MAINIRIIDNSVKTSESDAAIKLKNNLENGNPKDAEGDILLFDEKNGYIKPAIQMQTAKEISDDFKALA